MSQPVYMLDTDTCIYITKHHPPSVMVRFENLSKGQVVMSFITFGELELGAQKSQHRSIALSKLERLRQIIPVIHSDDELSKTYGKVRAVLEQSGTPIGSNDYWIAAHALSGRYTLVTNNTREFSRIPDLKIENWVS